MKRILLVTVTAAALLVVSPSLVALGLGAIETTSALNEPFEGRIKLVNPTAEEVSTLRVKLADAEAFRRAGVDRPFSLTKLKFEVVETPRGADFIRITSSDAILEPFLNFLVEVNWAKGRLFREYTVLLDPPLYDPNRRRLVQAPAVSAPTPGAAPRRDVAPSPPQRDGSLSPPGVAPPGRGASGFTESAPSTSPTTPRRRYSGGPTVRGDTLWAIALDVRPDRGVSIQQTMLALLRANPDAFFLDGNINALKTGYVLQVPDRETVASTLTQSDAIARVSEQNALWEEYRQRVAAGDVSPRPEGPAVSSADVRETAPDATEAPDRATAGATPPPETAEEAAPAPVAQPIPEPEGRLELVSPSEAGSEGAVADIGQQGDPEAMRDELALKSEMLEAKSQENKELLDRLEEAEGLIEDLQRLVALKDDELASLQAQLGEDQSLVAEAEDAVDEAMGEVDDLADDAAAAAGEVAGEPDIAEQEPGDQVDDAGLMDDEGEPLMADEPLDAEPLVEDTDAAEPAADGLTMEDTPAADGEPEPGAAPQAEAEPVATAPAVLPPPPEPGFMERVQGFVPAGLRNLVPGGALTILGVLGAVLLGLIALVVKLITRGRAETITEDQILKGLTEEPAEIREDSLEPITEVGDDSLAVPGEEPDDTVTFQQTMDNLEPTSTLPGTAIDDDATELDFAAESGERTEEDPLAEVNVYLAYERFDQAEELVKKAIADFPDEHKYKLRLLEVYYSANDQNAFEREAQVLHGAVNGSGSLWDSAVAMWNEMSPQRALFEGGVPAAAPADREPAGMVDISAEARASGMDTQTLEESMAKTMAIAPGAAAALGSKPTEIDVPLDAADEDKTALDFELDADDASEEATLGAADLAASLDASALPPEPVESGDEGEGATKVVDLSAEGDLDEIFDSTVDPDAKHGVDHDLLDVSASARVSGLGQDDILDITSSGKKDDSDGESTDDVVFDLTSSLAQLEASLGDTGDLADTGGDLGLEVSSEDITERNEGDSSTLEEAPDFLDITGEHPVLQDVSTAGGESDEGGDDDNVLEFDIAGLGSELESSLSSSLSSSLKSMEQDDALSASASATDIGEAFDITAMEQQGDTPLSSSASNGLAESLDLTGSGYGMEAGEDTNTSDLDLVLETEDSTDVMDEPDGATVELPGAQVTSLELDTADESLDDLARALEETVSGIQAESTGDEISLDLDIEPEDPGAELGTSTQPGTRPERTVNIPVGKDVASEQSMVDEVDTKLNLAKAYIELGDTEGAKAILAEVASDGTEDQKRQAAELTKDLS